MTQVKTCLCVPFLFGFPSFTIFLVKNKASASFSFGKWPAFFVGIDISYGTVVRDFESEAKTR